MNTLVITGGSKGIGLAIAQKFVEEKWFVISLSRSKTSTFNHENFHQINLDVRIEKDFQETCMNIKANFGEIDAFVNNAGFSEWRNIEAIDRKFLDEIFSINVFGYFYGFKYGKEIMKPNGSFVNINSLASRRGTINNSAYVATKFAVAGLMQSMSKELGAKGIRVNAINPVLIETGGLITALEDKISPAQGDYRNFLDNFRITQTALGRLPTAEEVANLAYFLAGPQSSGITGQSINVDCGVLPN